MSNTFVTKLVHQAYFFAEDRIEWERNNERERKRGRGRARGRKRERESYRNAGIVP